MSEQGKHTPGPWQTLPEEVDRDYIRVRGTRLGCKWRIANVPHTILPGRTFGVEETRANAHLIAAAPDLLRAAKEARAALQEFITEEPASEWMAVALLDHAIAKAEGRT